MPKSSRLVQVICARSAYLHTGQRPYQAALEGLIHDRTRSRDRAAQNLLARMGASIHGACYIIPIHCQQFPSALSAVHYRVEFTELDAGVLGSELPIGPGGGGVAPVLPGLDVALQRRLVAHPVWT